MIGATFCSGIGAPEVAAPWVDWRLASEIEPFPRAVLQERFGYRLPEDHNQGDPLLWGDMTEVTPDLLRSRGIPLPDLIVAGTPCQDFSVAGLREGLSGDRGNLTLSFVEICHAIVAARPDGKLAVLWENVPGVLSDSGNAFGCFLGGLVGAMDALPPPADGSWPCEGMVQGPRARAAWSILDAQWFGLAQRRKRVFVVVDFGNCVDPAAVLLEPDRLRGDSPPRREAGQGAAAGTAQGVGVGGDAQWPAEVAPTLNAAYGDKMGLEDQHALSGAGCFVPGFVADVTNAITAHNGQRNEISDMTNQLIAHALRGEGFDASEDGTGRGTPIVPVDVAGTMKACRDSGGWSNSADHAAAGYMVPVAFGAQNSAAQGDGVSVGYSPTLDKSKIPAVAVPVAIQERAVSENPNAGPQGKGWQEDVGYTLEARHHVQAVAFAQNTRDEVRMVGGDGGIAGALGAEPGAKQQTYLAQPWAVRRLMPVECARLQGFPDDHTAITYRSKPAADGPQYKAYGNSMATPCIKWILDRMRISMRAAE